MKKLLLLALVLITANSFSQDKPVDVPKIMVKIALGETVQFKKASVKFIKVLEDSRCPSDVTCIWEGQAKVLVEVTEPGMNPRQVELLYGKRINEDLFALEGYTLKGISLSPYPTSESVGNMAYALLVSEEGN